MTEPTKRQSLIPSPSKQIAIPAGYQQPRLPVADIPAGYQQPRLPVADIRTFPENEHRLPTPVGNIAKGIASVMKEVGTIKKGGHNAFHNYRYARMEDLLHAVTPLMGQQGLAVLQNEVSRATVENNQACVTYEFIVIHESSESLPPQRFTGMALFRDSKGNVDDKSINKCHTAAR